LLELPGGSFWYGASTTYFRHGRQRLTDAFKALRKQKMVTRQNHSCCGSCSAYEIGTFIEERNEQGKGYIGAVHYNRQAKQHMDYLGNVMLDYGGVEDGPKTTVEIGQMVVEALEAEGLTAVWDGNRSSSIKVYVDYNVNDCIEVDDDTRYLNGRIIFDYTKYPKVNRSRYRRRWAIRRVVAHVRDEPSEFGINGGRVTDMRVFSYSSETEDHTKLVYHYSHEVLEHHAYQFPTSMLEEVLLYCENLFPANE
jgi:hypothetical protein